MSTLIIGDVYGLVGPVDELVELLSETQRETRLELLADLSAIPGTRGRVPCPQLADLELPDDVKPANSHLALNVITGPDGEEQKIMRFNMPFGRVGRAEFGTYYIAYARSSELIERMLRNMFIGDPPGNTDRILDFSTAVTGGLFFIPPADLLEGLNGADGSSEGVGAEDGTDSGGAPAPASGSGDGSLSIGSLRDQP